MAKLIALAVLLFFYSCKNDDAKDKLIEELGKTIEKNNRRLQFLNEDFKLQINSYKFDSWKAGRLAIWSPKLNLVTTICEKFINDIERFKKNDNSINWDTVYFKTKNLQVSLLKLDFIKQTGLEKEIANWQNNKISVGYIKSLTSSNQYNVLYLLENSVLNFENFFIDYVNNEVDYDGCRYTRYDPLVSTNKTYFKNGDTLELNAGIVSFSNIFGQKAFANGKEMQQTFSGMFEKKVIITKPNGTYELPIKIEYKDTNTGEERTVSKTIKYIVE